jgi:hypothetical protein
MYKQNQKSKRSKTEGKTVQSKFVNSQIMLSNKNFTPITQNTISVSKEQFDKNTTDNSKAGYEKECVFFKGIKFCTNEMCS